MKRLIQFLFIFLFLLSVNYTKAGRLIHKQDSVSVNFSKKEKQVQKAKQLLNTKFGKWLLKRAIKKAGKRQIRFERKVARKKAKKGENWKPKKQKTNDVAGVIAIIFFIIGVLFGIGGLFTLPFNNTLANELFYAAGGFFCAGGGILAT